MWVIRLKTHPCRAFLWALHGHSRAGRKSTRHSPGAGCQACHPGPGTRSSGPPRNPSRQPSGTAAPLASPPGSRSIGVGGARILESANGEGCRGAMQIACFLLGVSSLSAWRSARLLPKTWPDFSANALRGDGQQALETRSGEGTQAAKGILEREQGHRQGRGACWALSP